MPTGLWGDGETVWVADYADAKLYAYAVADGSRRADQDFDTLAAAGNNQPVGVWSNGETVWVADNVGAKLYAYRLADKARVAEHDVSLSGYRSPGGLWGDGETLWVEIGFVRARAFELADGTRADAKDFSAWPFSGGEKARGLWSDGATVWATTIGGKLTGTRKAYAFRDGARVSNEDIDLPDFGSSSLPMALWSNGESMGVVDARSGKLYWYPLPSPSSNASLTLLELSQGDLGAFSPSDTSYAAEVAHDTESVTLTAMPASGARVAIAPADADTATDGHQVTLAEGLNTITITVTAADGTTTRTYTVTVERAAPPSNDATLNALTLTGVDIGTFSADVTDYAASVSSGPTTTMVEAKATDTGARVTILPVDADSVTSGHQVALRMGADNVITVYVIAADRTTTRTYTVRVTVAASGAGTSARLSRGGSARSVSGASPVALTAGLTVDARRVAAPARGVAEPARKVALAPGNARPAGLWSDGERLWVANADDGDRRLYAYRLADGARESARDIETQGVPQGLWSDGETVWASTRAGAGVLEAYRLADGARDAGRDIGLEGRQSSPAGLWSDGTTLWAVDWLSATVEAYRLADGARDAGRDVDALGPAGNLMAFDVWSDGETMWVSDDGERVYAYHVTDGTRSTAREVEVGSEDWDPTGVWSDETTLWLSGRNTAQVRGWTLPPAANRLQLEWTVVDSGNDGGEATGVPVRIADAALRARIEAALGKGAGEAIAQSELAALEVLDARGAGVVDLAGLEGAVGLVELDLSFNPLEDLGALASLGSLERLYLDGAVAPGQLQSLSGLADLRVLSVRSNALADLSALGRLSGLRELDAGENRLADLSALAGWSGLTRLRADRNRLAGLSGVGWLTGLEVLDVSRNGVSDLSPLAPLSALRRLTVTDNAVASLSGLGLLTGLEELGLAGNAVADLRGLRSLSNLRRLDLRGNRLGDVAPLAELASLEWVHLGGCGLGDEDWTALEGRWGLTVEGRFDQSRP